MRSLFLRTGWLFSCLFSFPLLLSPQVFSLFVVWYFIQCLCEDVAIAETQPKADTGFQKHFMWHLVPRPVRVPPHPSGTHLWVLVLPHKLVPPQLTFWLESGVLSHLPPVLLSPSLAPEPLSHRTEALGSSLGKWPHSVLGLIRVLLSQPQPLGQKSNLLACPDFG